MSLLDQIRSAKPLRKVGIEHDASAPKVTDVLEISAQYDRKVLQANIENWAHILDSFTARTVYIPLSQDHGKLLKEAYEDLERRPQVVQKAAEEYITTAKHVGYLNSQEKTLEETLGPEIQNKIDELSVGSGCFVKLSSRSPKDAAARSGVFRRLYQDQIVDKNTGKLRQLTENEKLRILCEADGAALRFKDSASVIRALVLSERVWQDMTLAFRHPESWNQSVVFREWDPVPIDLEFRTFVYNNRMTCISQYAYQLYSERLNDQGQQSEIISTVHNFFTSSLLPALSKQGFTDYVLDIGIIPENNGWRPSLIELNPFEETTDGALFSWTRERDILEGKATDVSYPLVRVTERARPGALAMIPKEFKTVIDKVEREFTT